MTNTTPHSADTIRNTVRDRYGSRATAQATQASNPTSCCSTDSGCCGERPTAGVNAFSADIYGIEDMEEVPLRAALARLGCANPTAVAALRPGDIVLDLGSGGGLDALLAARRVGATGHVYGIDMTDEMLGLAWQNAADAGIGNVSFLKGNIEQIPLPDATIDVVISNCVINLAVDKRQVVAETWRVLRPGGRLAIADVVIQGGLPQHSAFAAALRADLYAWGSCVGGALSDDEYLGLLRGQGFTGTRLDILRRHDASDLFPTGLPEYAALEPADVVEGILARFASAIVRAEKS